MKIHRSIYILSSLVALLGFQATAFSDEIPTGFLPIAWVDADISNVFINQATAPSSSGANISLVSDDPSAGYRQIKSYSLDLKAGIYGGWIPYGGTFAQSLFGFGVTIMPVVGSTMVMNRKVENNSGLQNQSNFLIPTASTALSGWSPHDSLTYDVRGGIIFSVGAGYAFTGLSGDYYASGDWFTYIEKLEGNRVYVKVTNVSLQSLDLIAGNFAANVMLSDFKKTDKMFSFNFDLGDPRAQVAYEAMIHGSMKEAQNLYDVDPSVANLVLTEVGGDSGNQIQRFLGLPFLNITDSSGTLYDTSDTILNSDQSESDVEYGFYWNEDHSNVFGHHETASENFYGVYYKTTSEASTTQTSVSGEYGTLILSYENDKSNDSTISDAISNMVERTGLREQLKLDSSPKNISGYVRLVLTVNIPESVTKNLMSVAQQSYFDRSQMDQLVQNYFGTLNDPEELCSDEPDTGAIQQCQDDYQSDSEDGLQKMHNALMNMSIAENSGDQKGFTQAYASFGKALLTNEFTFKMMTQIVQTEPIAVSFNAEGAAISQVTQNFTLPAATPTAMSRP